MSDQAVEQSVEDRMTSFFSADAGQPAQPEVAQQESSASEESVEQPAIEADDAAEQPAEEADSGYEEVELDGETYRVPPKLKEAVLRQADYTRKTQEVAEASRQVQVQQQALALQAQFQQATVQDQQQLQHLESQIAQYRQLDWANMDTDTLTRARHQLDTLKEQSEALRNGLSYKAQQFQAHNAQVRQQQLQQGIEYLRKAIPKFDADTISGLRSYAVGEGYTAPEMEQVTDPRFVKLLYKAAEYDRLKSSQKSAVEAVKKAPPVIRPGASKGQGHIAQTRIKQATERLKKTGGVDDFANALLARGFK